MTQFVKIKTRKSKGSDIGIPDRKVVYSITVETKSGSILEDEMAFNKKAKDRIVKSLDKEYSRKEKEILGRMK